MFTGDNNEIATSFFLAVRSVMAAHELESLVSKLEKALSAFSQELGLALRYIQADAASSLTKSRIVKTSAPDLCRGDGPRTAKAVAW
jgi:hypothetical protein